MVFIHSKWWLTWVEHASCKSSIYIHTWGNSYGETMIVWMHRHWLNLNSYSYSYNESQNSMHAAAASLLLHCHVLHTMLWVLHVNGWLKNWQYTYMAACTYLYINFIGYSYTAIYIAIDLIAISMHVVCIHVYNYNTLYISS